MANTALLVAMREDALIVSSYLAGKRRSPPAWSVAVRVIGSKGTFRLSQAKVLHVGFEVSIAEVQLQ